VNESLPLRLHGYWRSTASYRVRIALAVKGISYEQLTHDLRMDAHRLPGYTALNPQGFVPALEVGDEVIPQSGAIIEWLEETYPDPPLLPADRTARAMVRSIAQIVACDIHPLNNLRVLRRLRGDLACNEAQVQAWIATWIVEGFEALETMIARHGGRFAFGDTVTMADCYILPQIYSAERFKVDLAPFPKLISVAREARADPAIAAAHPDRQPDSD